MDDHKYDWAAIMDQKDVEGQMGEKGHPDPVGVEVKAVRYDTGKVNLSLLPTEALEDISRVLEFGARKYSDWNWAKGLPWTNTANSLLRHMFAWMRGEDNDPESGLSHLSHVGCNILFLIHYSKYRKEFDNRFKPKE